MSDALTAEIVRLRDDEGLTFEEIGQRVNMHPEACRGRYRRAKKQASRTYRDRREPPDAAALDAFYRAIREAQEAYQRLQVRQTEVTVQIHETKPFGIAWWGDWHIGSVGVDYETFDRHRRIIAEEDGLYWIGGGDYKENILSDGHKGAMYHQIIQPGMQDELILSWMEDLGPSCLALVEGNHDAWDARESDRSLVEEMAIRAGVPYLWYGGVIWIEVGEQRYKWVARHKYKYESSLNTTNAQRQLSIQTGGADVVSLAHKHFVDFQARQSGGRKTIFIRCGTYKVWDDYGQAVGGHKGEIGVPIVILYPDQHKVVGFDSFEDGLFHLRALRGGDTDGEAADIRRGA